MNNHQDRQPIGKWVMADVVSNPTEDEQAEAVLDGLAGVRRDVQCGGCWMWLARADVFFNDGEVRCLECLLSTAGTT